MSAPITPALRPMLPTDGPALAAIFRAAIDSLTAELHTRRLVGSVRCV